VSAGTATPGTMRRPDREALLGAVRRGGWTLGIYLVLFGLIFYTWVLNPRYGLDTLAMAALPLAFAAAAQAVVVISGGIDLSVGAMMALTSVTAAVLMKNASPEAAVGILALVLVLGIVVGAVNGLLVVITRVPDIVVTLAMAYVWAGAALLVLDRPGGGAADWVEDMVKGSLFGVVPNATVVLALVVAAVWVPLRRSRLGLSLYALGSNPLAAFRSGVPVQRTKVVAYAVCGLFAAAGGLALTATTGIGTPTTGDYTLKAVAAIVLGGVSLAGGRGGILGPIAAAYILGLIRADLVFMGVDPNYSTMIQGGIMVMVVMVASYLELRRRRR
jgi:ribose transport system permease protein